MEREKERERDSLQGEEILVEGSHARQKSHEGLLNQHISTVLVLEEQSTDLVKIPHQKLLTRLARHRLPWQPGSRDCHMTLT